MLRQPKPYKILSCPIKCSVEKNLVGKICIVTGASRGVGRGIALGLGEAGATVYVTGRSLETPSEGFGVLGGTISATAQLINDLGGVGIPVQVDHGNDEEVRALFERVKAEHGRLDVLVNNAWGVPMDIDNLEGSPKTFWEQGPRYYDAMFPVGVRSTFVASCLAAPLLMGPQREGPGGLIVNVSSFAALTYTFCVTYGTAKAAVERMTSDMAFELRPFDVACLQLWPGVVRSERMNYLDQKGELPSAFNLSRSESPIFSGRAVAALVADHARAMLSSGQRVVTAELAEELGFTDEDGTQPPSIRDLRHMVPFVCDTIGMPSPPAWMLPAFKVPFKEMEGEPPEWLFKPPAKPE
eukprot:CAMPEP_0196575310 /NCGR_PEP_ID=MMETSP1081-20130531/4815_1 /TAXON_ID=36882 /ORGANISM="Pyramimonas amylifera, Strain CCMP720" /LENGTH=353 /DNA_ID=CAMNT_0041893571 /DNA_START=60 /DNA_END=1121 /DNA_ORIENTATION=-